jgi:prophage DNA circulation protein
VVQYEYVPLTEQCSEKYGKRLIGRTDLEDALKRLDKLTQEEARMATAEVLRTTRAIEEGVTGVGEQVLVVDDRVAGVDDRVAGVDNRVAGVDDKVTEVIKGARIIFSRAQELLNLDRSDMKQTANDVNQVKRSLHHNVLLPFCC